jgi:hypothetical protein
MSDNRALPSEGEPISLEEAITILADGRPIRRSLRKECIYVICKAMFKLRALESVYTKADILEKQIAKDLIESFEKETKNIIRTFKRRYNINE